ncbi:hypothetical protein QC762_0031920 [Podospora pseudocomata]|uniref:Uncharacterized protein n=1 Tax=Podospora pseudocomata TaxID=2093779 RepID=A0ABR0GPZ6_9PEZI|nr:hypothetical protein QC762_0031920 [Podospora pseudocomata]
MVEVISFVPFILRPVGPPPQSVVSHIRSCRAAAGQRNGWPLDSTAFLPARIRFGRGHFMH